LSTSDNAEAIAILEGMKHCQRLGAPFIHVRTDNMGCKELLDGTSFPKNPGCLRLYLFLMTVSAQIFSYKVFSHSIATHRDILNDAADTLATLGRAGNSMSEVHDTSLEHLEFLHKPIPRYNPGKEGEEPPATRLPVTSHSEALTSFHSAARTSIFVFQLLKHNDVLKCNFRWLNFPGSPPAIVSAPIMRQQYLFHLRHDLHSHFERHLSLHHFRTTCPFCGSLDNSSTHRVFNCSTTSPAISTSDILLLNSHRRDLRAFRECYTSLLPLNEDGSIYPRSDSDYLYWLSGPSNLIILGSNNVRALSISEMQKLADACHGLHMLFTKYTMLTNAPVPTLPPRTAPSRAPNARSPSQVDCTLITSRYTQCRTYDEFLAWQQWHGYSPSTIVDILRRTGYSGFLPDSLARVYKRLELVLSACLCSYSDARRHIMSPYYRGQSLNLTEKVYNLLRAGNHMNVPITVHHKVERPDNSHFDMPDFFYSLPFHYVNSSPLVEAWFAAPSTEARRNLIEWPAFADLDNTIACPKWKLFDFINLPKGIYMRTGGGNDKGSRPVLHPEIEFLYELLEKAIRFGNIRITWRRRYQLEIDTAAPSTAVLIKRRLIMTLIFGSVCDVENYSPRDAVCSFFYSSPVESVVCVPICYQNRRVSHIPGFSLPVRGETPHAPKRSIFLGVQSQIADYRMAMSLALPPPDLEPCPRRDAMAIAATAAAVKAMADSATTWAVELINSFREVSCLDPRVFPALELPARVSSSSTVVPPHPLSGLFDDDSLHHPEPIDD
jgi:hypothetical protein